MGSASLWLQATALVWRKTNCQKPVTLQKQMPTKRPNWSCCLYLLRRRVVAHLRGCLRPLQPRLDEQQRALRHYWMSPLTRPQLSLAASPAILLGIRPLPRWQVNAHGKSRWILLAPTMAVLVVHVDRVAVEVAAMAKPLVALGEHPQWLRHPAGQPGECGGYQQVNPCGCQTSGETTSSPPTA